MRVRTAVPAATLAILLAVVLPVGPVAAAGKQGKGQSASASKGRSESKGTSSSASKGSSKGTSSSASKGSSNGASASASKDSSNASKGSSNGASASASKGANGNGGSSSKAAAKGNNGRGGDRGDAQGGGNDKGFPYETGAPGNNGTVKVRSTGSKDGDHRNEPHVGCEFWLHYWNFDDPATGTATFTAHPPTGSGQTLLVDDVTVGEYEVSGSYSLVGAFEALGIEPHHKQGYHVKLTTNADFSLGADNKHKVFWVNCPVEEVGAAEAPAVTEQPSVGQGDEVQPGEQVQAGEQVQVEERPAQPEQVAGEFLQAGGAQPTAIAAERGARGAVLPFTGSSIAMFLVLGLGLITSGAALVRSRRV